MTRREWLYAGFVPLAVVDVRDHGATGRGTALESPAIQKAIDAAASNGGGTVCVPAGRYICGTLRLRSSVSLWIDNGAALVMSQPGFGFRTAGKTGLPHTRRSSHVRIPQRPAGGARASATLPFTARAGSNCNREKGGGPKPISLKRCSNVAVRGITIDRAPSYNISLLGCEFVVIDGVTIRNGFSDGIDPDCCRHVRISNCFVESVDDAIVLKASLALGERSSTEHVTVTNCVLRTASLFLKCGTESSGDFRNIAFSNCTLIGGMGNRHGNPGIGLYTVDGGTLEGVAISNITMQNVGIPIVLRRGARGRGQPTPQPGPLRDVAISSLVAIGARRPSVIAGLPEARIANVTLSDIAISLAGKMEGPLLPSDVPEKPGDYPDPTMFGPLPASGLYIRHSEGLALRNVEIRPQTGDSRAALLADDVHDLRGYGVRTGRVWFHNVRRAAWLDYEWAGNGPAAVVSGANTAAIAFRAVPGASPESIQVGTEVPRESVRSVGS